METQSSSLTRVNTINEVSSLLNNSTRILENITKSLGWDAELFACEEEPKYVECPINKNHVMQSCYLDKHIHNCRLRHLGVDVKKNVGPSSCFFYKPSSSVVSVLTSSSKEELSLPPDALLFTQSPEERLRCYDHIVEISKTKRKNEEELLEGELTVTEDSSKDAAEESEKSKLELLAEQRDYKRRRQSYRAKNVHITKRTPTDIMREIINNRMEELRSQMEEDRQLRSNQERKT